MNGWTIGRIARESGVGVETIRFYEREGLIEPPPRTPSGYRQFPPDTVRRVRFIRQAKDLGFTLKEIRELLTLRTQPDRTCDDVRMHAIQKIRDIESRIARLERIRSSLEHLIEACARNADAGHCPILDSLEGNCF